MPANGVWRAAPGWVRIFPRTDRHSHRAATAKMRPALPCSAPRPAARCTCCTTPRTCCTTPHPCCTTPRPCCTHLEASLADADLGINGAIAHVVIPAQDQIRRRFSGSAPSKQLVCSCWKASRHTPASLWFHEQPQLLCLCRCNYPCTCTYPPPRSHVHKAHPKRQIVARQVLGRRLHQQLACSRRRRQWWQGW